MSIYSGFARRAQETMYNKLVYKTIEVLTTQIMASRSHKLDAPAEEPKFRQKVLKLYKALHNFEKMKHLEPNMTGAFHTLAKMMYYEIKKDSLGSAIGSGRQQSLDSNGFLEGLSASNFRVSDELSNIGSELSMGHSALNYRVNLETIEENPSRRQQIPKSETMPSND
jgi:hypothetical protein